jgi:hypothetical protein
VLLSFMYWRRRRTGAATDRGLSVALDRVEQRLATLFLEHLAHEVAERVHVVAQRRVLERKEDAFASHFLGLETAGPTAGAGCGTGGMLAKTPAGVCVAGRRQLSARQRIRIAVRSERVFGGARAH